MTDETTDAADFFVLRAMRASRALVPLALRAGFTRRYVSALLVMATLVSSAYFVVSRLVDTQASAAAVVNVSGRQRMLSQRIALAAGLLPGSSGATRAELQVTMSADVSAMAAAQHALLTGDAARGLPGHPNKAITALFQGGTAAAVDDFVADARRLLTFPAPEPQATNPVLISLQARAFGPLLQSLDQIVQAYQNDSQTRIVAIQREEAFVLLISLLTLTAEAMFVFRPMKRRIEREKERLEAAAQRHQAVTARHAFSLRLREAFDLADSETDLVDTVLQAVAVAEVAGHSEVLLEQPGRGLVAMLDSPAHGCSVTTPDGCPALRRGRTLNFPDSGALGACSHLRRDSLTAGTAPVASICVPVTFLGQGIGILRTVRPAIPGRDTDEYALDTLETVASTAGTHIGTLRAFARSRSDAERDPLTAVLNRRGLDHAVSRLEAQHCPYLVIVADLDHFKAINDTHGHDVGDTVLIAASRAISAALRPGDILARHGGEEFTIVLPVNGDGQLDKSGLADGIAVAERIRASVAAAHHSVGGPPCTASLGVTGPVTTDLEAAMRRADAALYRAKSLGRNRVEVAGDLVGDTPADLNLQTTQT